MKALVNLSKECTMFRPSQKYVKKLIQ